MLEGCEEQLPTPFAGMDRPSLSRQLRSTNGGEPVPRKAATLRQRLSIQLQRSLPSTHSLSSISTRSVRLKNSNSIWATVSSKAHGMFSRSVSSHSIRSQKPELFSTPTLATIQEGAPGNHVGACTLPEEHDNAATLDVCVSPTRAILTVDYNPPESHFHMPRAVGIVVSPVDQVGPPRASGASVSSRPNGPDKPQSPRREKTPANPSGRSLPLSSLLPRRRLLPLASIRRSFRGTGSPAIPASSLQTRRHSLKRASPRQRVSSQDRVDSSGPSIQGELQHGHAVDKQAEPLSSSPNTSRVKRKSPPSSSQQPPEESLSYHSLTREPSRRLRRFTSVKKSSNRSSSPAKIPGSTIKSRDLNAKPLPRLPPQRRQHRVSMKPPSFIPLGLTRTDILSLAPRNLSSPSSVQSPLSVHTSTKSPSFFTLNAAIKSPQVTGQKPLRTLNGVAKTEPSLPKRAGQENQQLASVSGKVHRNARRPQKIIRSSVPGGRTTETVDLSVFPKKLAGATPRPEPAQMRRRRIKLASPRTAPPKTCREGDRDKPALVHPRTTAVSTSTMGRRTSLCGVHTNVKRCPDELMMKNTLNQIPSTQENTCQAKDDQTAGTAMGRILLPSETLDLEGIALDEVPVAAERPLTALFQPATDLSMRPLLVRSPKRLALQDRNGKNVAAYTSHDRSVSHFSISTASIPSTFSSHQIEASHPPDPFQASTSQSSFRFHSFSPAHAQSASTYDPDPLTRAKNLASPVQENSTSIPARLQRLRSRCAATMPTKTLSSALDWIARGNNQLLHHDASWTGDDTESLDDAWLRCDRLLSFGYSPQGRGSGATLTDCCGDLVAGSMEASTVSNEVEAAEGDTWNDIDECNDVMLDARAVVIRDRNGAIGAGEVARKPFEPFFDSDDHSTTAERDHSFLDVRFSYFSPSEASFQG